MLEFWLFQSESHTPPDQDFILAEEDIKRIFWHSFKLKPSVIFMTLLCVNTLVIILPLTIFIGFLGYTESWLVILMYIMLVNTPILLTYICYSLFKFLFSIREFKLDLQSKKMTQIETLMKSYNKNDRVSCLLHLEKDRLARNNDQCKKMIISLTLDKDQHIIDVATKVALRVDIKPRMIAEYYIDEYFSSASDYQKDIILKYFHDHKGSYIEKVMRKKFTKKLHHIDKIDRYIFDIITTFPRRLLIELAKDHKCCVVMARYLTILNNADLVQEVSRILTRLRDKNSGDIIITLDKFFEYDDPPAFDGLGYPTGSWKVLTTTKKSEAFEAYSKALAILDSFDKKK